MLKQIRSAGSGFRSGFDLFEEEERNPFVVRMVASLDIEQYMAAFHQSILVDMQRPFEFCFCSEHRERCAQNEALRI
jgi:hypothetical protein